MPKDEPGALDKFKELYKPIDDALDTHEHHQIGAMHYAQEKVLKDDKTGKIMYTRLDKGFTDKEGKKHSPEEVRKMIREHVIDYLAKNAVEDDIKKLLSGIKDKKKRKALVEAFTPYNDIFLQQQQDAHGSAFKWVKYIETTQRKQGQFRMETEAHTTEHLNKDHIEDVLEEVGVETVGTPKLEQVKELLTEWARNDRSLTEEAARKILTTQYKGLTRTKEEEKDKAA